MSELKVLELFGGIGACSSALERLGIDFEIVDYVEIDKYAVKSFNVIHNTDFEPQDITKWDKDIKIDLIMHGSPCQNFSIAGKQAGGDEGSGTRSSLMYETIRIVNKLKPKYVIWENVKNILSDKHKHNFDNYLKALEQLGYTNYYQVLDAKDYGVPQHRERVFTISILNDTQGFIFPSKQPLKIRLKDILDDVVDEKYYLSDIQVERIKATTYNAGKRRIQEKDWCDTLLARDWKDPKCIRIGGLYDKDGERYQAGSIYDPNGICPTLDTCSGGNRQPFVVRHYENIIEEIRKLTPKEYWRLMGFSDEDFDKAQGVDMSNSQLYKQAGNSIVVNILVAIFKNLLLYDKWSDLD